MQNEKTSRLDITSALVIVASMALYIRFMVLDARAPTDMGHYYTPLIDFLKHSERDGAMGNLHLLATPYSAMLAGLMLVLAPSAGLMEAVDGIGLFVLLVASWKVARVVAGPTAGLVAVLLVAGFPQTQVMARIHWIHHPESAAIMGALAIGVAAPALATWPQRIGAFCFLLLGLTTRETGLPFGLPVAMILTVGAWRAGSKKMAIFMAFTAMLGVGILAPTLLPYLAAKIDNASGYAAAVGNPFPVLIRALCVITFVAAVPFALLGFTNWKHRGWALVVTALALIWVLGGIAAVAVYHVGIDNFPLVGVGIALAAGIGAARWAWLKIPAIGSTLVAATLVQGSALVSPLILTPIDSALAPYGTTGPLNYLRVYWGAASAAMLRPIAERACQTIADQGWQDCLVLVSRGLFNPSWEDGGSFGMYLEGMRKITIMTPPEVWGPQGNLLMESIMFHAVVDVECNRGVAPDTGGRFEAQETRLAEVFETLKDTTPTASVGDPRSCTQTWYTLREGIYVK